MRGYTHLLIAGFITLCGSLGPGSASTESAPGESAPTTVSSVEACEATNECIQAVLKNHENRTFIENITEPEQVFQLSGQEISKLCSEWRNKSAEECVRQHIRPCNERGAILKKFTMFIHLCREDSSDSSNIDHTECMANEAIRERLGSCREDYNARVDELDKELEKGSVTKEQGRRQLCLRTDEFLTCGAGIVNVTCGNVASQYYRKYMERSLPPDMNYDECKGKDGTIDLAIIIIACVIGALILLLLVVCCIVIIYCCGKHYDSSSYVVINSV